MEDIPEIMDDTEEYKKEGDYYAEFVEEMIVKTGDKSDRIPTLELKDRFLEWLRRYFREHNIKESLPLKKDIKKALEDILGEETRMRVDSKNSKGWYCVKWLD
ncbi:unnamed protein product, partial [marine sediment metagenome]